MSGETDEEVRLQRLIRRVRLIGEVPVTPEAIGELEGKLAHHIARQRRTLQDEDAPIEQIGQSLTRSWPHRLAFYLVGKGIFEYRAGEYWPAVLEPLGLYNTRWREFFGDFFEWYLEQCKLPRFTISEPNQRYLSQILLHGGIPVYCLGDLFGRLLYPTLDQPDLATLPTAALIDHWLRNAAQYYHVDKPVWRFLRYGDEVARDFVDRCRELVRLHAQQGHIPAASEVGLPGYVVAGYEHWQRQTDQRPPQSGGKRPLQRPVIWLDPWGEGVQITLPAQSLAATPRAVSAVWTITGQTSQQHEVRVFGGAGQAVTEPDCLPLPAPAARWEIAFCAGLDAVQRWAFAGFDQTRPLLVFSGRTGNLLDWWDRLPADDVWLVLPYDQQHRCLVAGGRCLTETIRLPGAWSTYGATRWDLRNAQQVTLGDQSFPVARSADRLRPRLEGGHPVAWLRGADREPVYIGAAPHLLLPSEGQHDRADQLDRWQLRIHDRVTTRLGPTSLSSVKAAATRTDEGWRLALDHPSLLGPAACGVYSLQLRGPLGRDADLSLTILPQLELTRQPNIRLPATDGQLPPVTLDLVTSPTLRIAALGDASTVTSQASAGHYCIQTATPTSQLTLRATPEAGSPFWLTLPLPALHWSLSHGERPVGGDRWRSALIEQPADWLATVRQPQLVVALHPPRPEGGRLVAQLAVLDPTGRSIQEIEPNQPTESRLTFRLSEASDTVRRAGPDGCCFALVIRLPGQGEVVRVPVLTLGTPRPTVLQAALAPSTPLSVGPAGPAVPATPPPPAGRAPQTRPPAAAAPPTPARPAQRVWSLWRPWEPPLTFEPDGGDAEAQLAAIDARLAPGRYRLEAIPDLNEVARHGAAAAAGAAQRPLAGAPLTCDRTIGSLQTRRSHLDRCPATVSGWLERWLAQQDEHQRDWRFQPFTPGDDDADNATLRHCLEALLVFGEDATAVTHLIDRQSDAVRDFVSWLRVRHPALLVTIIERQATLSDHQRTALQRLLIAIGLLDAPVTPAEAEAVLTSRHRAALLSFWPSLAATLDPAAVRVISGSRLAPGAPTMSRRGTTGLDIAAWLVLPTIEADFGRRPPPLRREHEPAAATPVAASPVTEWDVMIAAWHTDLRESPDRWRSALAWQEKYVVDCVGALERVRRALPELRPIADRLKVRADDRRRGEPAWREQPANVPFMVGVTVLVLRCLAHYPQSGLALGTDGSAWRRHALRAFDLAPLLFDHDLALMDLALVLCQLAGRNEHEQHPASA